MSLAGGRGLRRQPRARLKGNKRLGAAVQLPEGRDGYFGMRGRSGWSGRPSGPPPLQRCSAADDPNQGPQCLPTKGNDRGRWRPRKRRKPHVANLELWTPRIYPAPTNLVGLVMERLLRCPFSNRDERGGRETAGGGRAARSGGDTIHRASRRTPHGRAWGYRSASPSPAVLLMARGVADAFLYVVRFLHQRTSRF